MDKSEKDFKFDKRASSYNDGFGGRFSKKFYRVLFSRLDLKPSSKVLDVGCGFGFLMGGFGGLIAIIIKTIIPFIPFSA